MRYLLSSALMLGSALSAFELENRIEKLEGQMQDLRVETVYGNHTANTATAYPVLNGTGGYASVDALCMQFIVGGTDFAWTDTDPSSYYQGALKYKNFDWRFGFRVIAGYEFDSANWDLWAEYMRITTSQSHRIHTPSGGGLYSNVYGTSSFSNSITFKERIEFNTADANLGRRYFLRKNVGVHPFVGLRGAWINQHQNVPMDNISGTTYTVKQKNDYGGLGLRTGSQIRWFLSRNWSLFGSFAASLMWGQFNNTFKLVEATSSTTTTDIDLNSDTRRILPNISTDAGVSYEYLFRTVALNVTLAYEFDYWWRQLQTLQLNTGTTYTYYRISEDLGLQGVKLNLGLDF